MTAARPRHVLLVVPRGREVRGGIGRMMAFLFEEWRRTGAVRARIVASRGAGNVLLSPLHVAAAILVMVFARLSGRIDVVHVNLSSAASTWRKALIAAAAARLALPIVLHLHSGRYPEFWGGLGPRRRAIAGRLFGRADRVLCLGEAWRRFVHEEIGVPPERLVVLPNAVPDPGPPAERRSGCGPVRILFLGRIGERKGAFDLVHALGDPHLRALPWRATIAGDGEGEALAAAASAAGIGDRVGLPGWLGEEETRSALARADIFVLPSRDEGLPMALLEAMAHGLAPVVTPVGAIPEVIEDGVNGLHVAPGDAHALARALGRLIEDGELRHGLGTAARATFLARHRIEDYARRLADLYDELCRDEAQASPRAASGEVRAR